MLFLSTISLNHHFNPHLRTRRNVSDTGEVYSSLDFNPHLRTRRNKNTTSYPGRFGNFNPHLRTRRNHQKFPVKRARRQFQSTPSYEKELDFFFGCTVRPSISIHTFVREGTTRILFAASRSCHFNPHLRTRRNVDRLKQAWQRKEFQSTPSYEKERGRVAPSFLLSIISIHTFVREGTATFSIS